MLCLLGFCFAVQSGEQSFACNLPVNAVCLRLASHIVRLMLNLRDRVTLSYVLAGLVTADGDDTTVELLLSAKVLLDGPLRLKSLAPKDIMEYSNRKGQLEASRLACKNARTIVAWTAVHFQNLCLKLLLPIGCLQQFGIGIGTTLYSMELGKLVCFQSVRRHSCSNPVNCLCSNLHTKLWSYHPTLC